VYIDTSAYKAARYPRELVDYLRATAGIRCCSGPARLTVRTVWHDPCPALHNHA
jgi:hypothetical protein